MKYPKRSQYKHAKQKKYHVSNWAEYNEGLRRRGDLTVWFDEEAIANWKADKSGKPGGQRVYSEMAIETGLVVRMVYKLAYPFGQEIRPSLRSRGTTRIRVDTAVLHELLRLNKATCDRRPIQE